MNIITPNDGYSFILHDPYIWLLVIVVVLFYLQYRRMNNKINERDRLRGYTKKQEREWKKLGTFEEELRRREK